jgi:hypothetical protein
VTAHRTVPSEVDAERLADLLADARAIPAAAFTPSKTAARRVVDLGGVPVQLKTAPRPTAMVIPDATVTLAEAAEQQWADFSR